MPLTFGVTVLPDPPYQRLVELIRLAEQRGFGYGWTYDSHVLWQDSIPTMALVAAATERIKLGHMVTNPGTREPTVVASAYATLQDISEGRMVMGIGRGDSARRYIGQQPVRVKPFEEALRMIKPFMNGEQVTWNGTEIELAWVRPELPPIEMHARTGSIAPGKDADLVVFDPSTPFEFSTRTSHMNVDYDLFEGESSAGSVRHTFCPGELVSDRGEIVTQPGQGQFVPRSLGAAAAVAT